MEISSFNNDLILSDVEDFSLKDTFECGQCFRWEKTSDGSYIGVAFSKALKIKQDKNTVTLFDTSFSDFENIWFKYFDFNTDYKGIKKSLSSDSVLKDAVSFGGGIRILNQQLWECAVSFIISASNNIPRIKKIINGFCRLYGEKIEYLSDIYYSFPSPEKIYSLSLEDLAPIKAGFRDKYILACADAFVNGYNEKYFENLDYEQSKRELLKISGVGNKVADCILLFSLAKRSSFPIDVWIKRVMEYYYFDNPQTVEAIGNFSKEKFGDLGGYAQQYLFYYARENKIGINGE